MFYFIFADDYQKLKNEYMMKKMEQMNQIQELEKQFEYYSQFFEPSIELKVTNDNLYDCDDTIITTGSSKYYINGFITY